MIDNLIELLSDIHCWQFWVGWSLVLAWLIGLLYYLIVFVRIGRRRKPVPYNPVVPVSVVICAKNEADNLKARLGYVLDQDYPDFEVVVVNDQSTDDTELILDEYKQKYPNLYVTEISHNPQFRQGKKLALTIGIKAAKHEWLLLTDADCIPVSKNWIRTMSQHFTEGNDFVLGYGGYEERSGLLNKLIRYDAGFIALQYFTFAEAGMPYMGVGRNLAYRKSLFVKSKGFMSHSRLMSGDDDLFVNENAKKRRVAVSYHPESFTTCESKETFHQWNTQKQRHFSASERYKGSHKFLLALEPMARSLFYLGAVALSFFEPLYLLTGTLFLTRYLVFMYTICKTANKFNIKGVKALALLFDIILPYINLAQMILGNLRKERLKWK
ncbi:MAG: glycosyltransferase [Bacteroidales bacterium]|nr:glycosyltransferase [Bacteroidales bacterium]